MNDDKKAAGAPHPPSQDRNGETPIEATNEGDVGTDQLKDMIKALQGELDKKTAEVAEKHDQLLRAVAETENVRRRLEKEKNEIGKYAIAKFAKDILTVGDNFQRAIAAVPKDAVATDPALKSFLDGVVLAERDFISALERHGVKLIDPVGEPFNPHHHQAVMEQENADVPAGTVLQVFQTGYLLEDRCLRPAMVVVSRGGPKADAGKSQTASQSNGDEPFRPDAASDPDTAG